ncbi:MAG: O-antigen ligase family protein [Acidobacteriota bacterium]
MARWLRPHAPAALLMLFSGWSGTFYDGAFGDWKLTGHLALLLFVAVFSPAWKDPLRLGRAGSLLLIALVALTVVSFAASPVPRAGLSAILLLPAFLLLPSSLERCWAGAEQRRLGLRSLAVVVGGVAVWSLVGVWHLETPGASLPLGHHNLLAAWLLVLLPVAAVSWREPGLGRWLSGFAVLAGTAALLLTRSLTAAVAVFAVGVWLALRHRWGRFGLLGAAALLGTQAPRLVDIVRGIDFSAIARWSYVEAGWRGIVERPALGWGPGSARWTLGEHFQPIPGIHPPDLLVADLHSLPLQLVYELGWVVLLLVLGLAALWIGNRRREEARDPELRRNALVGLAALVITSLAGRTMAISALPLAVAMVVGMAQAGGEAPRVGPRRWPGLTAMAILTALLLPLGLAQVAYDRAVAASQPADQLRFLAAARRLDPGFPLYRARQAHLQRSQAATGSGLAEEARSAAASARGVSALWLIAGQLGQEAGAPWSREALQRACDTSPLGALAPYFLSLEAADPVAQRQWAARALLAEPVLMAARAWQSRPARLAEAVGLTRDLDRVEARWREALALSFEALGPPSQLSRSLALTLDADATTSVSLHAFRRQPWPAHLARVEVDGEQVIAIDLPAASELGSTDSTVFASPGCGLAHMAPE